MYIYICVYVYMIPFSESVVNIKNNHCQIALVVKMTSILITASLSCIQTIIMWAKWHWNVNISYVPSFPKAARVRLYRTMHSTLQLYYFFNSIFSMILAHNSWFDQVNCISDSFNNRPDKLSIVINVFQYIQKHSYSSITFREFFLDRTVIIDKSCFF